MYSGDTKNPNRIRRPREQNLHCVALMDGPVFAVFYFVDSKSYSERHVYSLYQSHVANVGADAVSNFMFRITSFKALFGQPHCSI